MESAERFPEYLHGGSSAVPTVNSILVMARPFLPVTQCSQFFIHQFVPQEIRKKREFSDGRQRIPPREY